MKTSETLYAAANYIRRYGFSPEYHRSGGCGCFMHAVEVVADMHDASDALETLRLTIFDNECGVFGEHELIVNGWNTDDATAACEIAADIAFAEGN